MKYNWNKKFNDKYNDKNDTLPVFGSFVAVIILLRERNIFFQKMYLSGETCASANISKGKPDKKCKCFNNIISKWIMVIEALDNWNYTKKKQTS